LSALRDRVERAERVSSERSGLDDEESIRRTLILAQRTADLAIKEAQEEAGQLLDGARVDAESIVSDARQTAERITADADKKLRDEVGRLNAERERLRGEIGVLSGLLGAERERLTESLSTMLRFVEKNLLTSPELASFAVTPVGAAPAAGSVAAPDVDELEAAIAADAAAAAPSPPPHRPDFDDGQEAQEPASRPSLMALPSLEEFGDPEPHTEPTAKWDMSGKADSPAS
ncbi:MAG: DivIVA domain-containing protein, partial [Acidimicrobiales bacterium]